MNIHIEVIPHNQQQYRTVGDWRYDEHGDLQIRVSSLSDWRREVLIAIHELVEVAKCKHDGVTQEAVDSFDMEFEKNRAPDNFDEPGDNPSAPYRAQHCLASGIERIMAKELDVVWSEYEKELDSLP